MKLIKPRISALTRVKIVCISEFWDIDRASSDLDMAYWWVHTVYEGGNTAYDMVHTYTSRNYPSNNGLRQSDRL